MPSRRRPSDPPALEIRRFAAPPEAAEAIRRLTVRIGDVQALDDQKTRHDDERVHATARKIRSTILEIFGERSPEYREHQYHVISATGHPTVMTSWDDEHAVEQDFVRRGIPRTITMLQALIETVGERTDWARPGPEQTDPAATPTASDDVFIVHGRNEGAREAVFILYSHSRREDAGHSKTFSDWTTCAERHALSSWQTLDWTIRGETQKTVAAQFYDLAPLVCEDSVGKGDRKGRIVWLLKQAEWKALSLHDRAV